MGYLEVGREWMRVPGPLPKLSGGPGVRGGGQTPLPLDFTMEVTILQGP